MLLILFGLPGAGKNYAGRIIAEMVDGHFHDADDDLTSEMRGYIERGEAITDPVRDRYYAVVRDRIGELCAQHDRLIVAQALIKRRHRNLIAMAHPHARFVLVEAPRALRVERLVRRGDGGVRVTASYADVIEAQFEYPLTPVPVLQNDADDAHIRQQAALLV